MNKTTKKLFRISFLFLIVCSSFELLSFIPHPSQMARFQSGLLNRSRPFISSGNVEFQGQSIPYKLEWYGPESYSVELQNIPSSLYRHGTGSSSWKLIRKQTLCSLQTQSQTVTCPSPQAWALLELSGVPEAGARGLFSAEILEAGEIVYQETNSTETDTLSHPRTSLVVTREGKTPAAHIELRGPRINTRTAGEEHPLIRFDQTFLAPMLLRQRHLGELFTIQASSDLEIRRGRTRYTYVLSTELQISSNLQLSLLVRREEPKINNALKAPTPQKSLAQLDAFRDTLSVPGQFLLDSIFLSH